MKPAQKELMDFVLAGKHRKRVLMALTSGGKTPSEISREIGALLSQVSRTLKELGNKDLVAGTFSREGKRVYILTEKAYRLIELIGSYVGRKYEEELSKIFDREGIEYARHISLKGTTGLIRPDFVIFKTGQPIIALTVIGGKTQAREGVDRMATRLKSIALDFQMTKKEHNSIFRVGALLGVTRGEAREKIVNVADSLEKEGWLDFVYFHDQIEDLISEIKK